MTTVINASDVTTNASNANQLSKVDEEREQVLTELMTEVVQRYFGSGFENVVVSDDWEATSEDVNTIIAVKNRTGLSFHDCVKFKCTVDTNTKRVIDNSYSVGMGEAYFAKEEDALKYIEDKYGLVFDSWAAVEYASENEVGEGGHSSFVGGFCTHGEGNLIYA